MILNSRPGLTLFCMALTLTIGVSSLSSIAFSQSYTFTPDVNSVNKIREQCDISKVSDNTDVSDVLNSFSQKNAFASYDKIIDQIRELCGISKVPQGAGVSDVFKSFLGDNLLGDNPTQIPIGTPISLTFIAAALQFLPSVLD
ncbi:MAG: hypothetical protein P0116_11650 [Candidatus Nitrosocosmicus sp.]|nr:hypothetical protein [Candidatus Nitrosocosmicus sp.]